MLDLDKRALEVAGAARVALASPMLRTVAPGAGKALGALVDLVEQMAHEVEILRVRIGISEKKAVVLGKHIEEIWEGDD